MKKLLLIGILCLGALTSDAQYSKILINNTTSCDVHIELYGDLNGSTCATTNYASNMLTISPGSVSYDPSMIPGGMNCFTCTPPSLGPSDIFWHALVYKTIGACPATTPFQLSDNTCLVNTFMTYATYDASCIQCVPDVNVKWTDMGTYIQLDIF